VSVSLAGIPFEDIYLEHRAGIADYVGCRVRDRGIVDDLVQDAFLRAIVHADQYTGDEDGIRPWLTGQAACAVGDYMWSQRRYLRAACTVLREVWSETAEIVARTAPAVPVNLAEALARMPETQRRTIQFRVLEGMSLNHVAAEMGCTQNTVVVRQRRALAALRQFAGVTS
jgi:RNA polymerase sigma-70 factor (ECF subfamily)